MLQTALKKRGAHPIALIHVPNPYMIVMNGSMVTMSTLKRRTRSKSPTASLGVLEFSSALNDDDPLLVLQKLRRFVTVVRRERRLSLSPRTGAGSASASSDDDDDDDDDSVWSLDAEEASTKRRKANAGSSAPAWQSDTHNYRVPFIGTAVARGATGAVVPGAWPTGFLAAYLAHDPSGAELAANGYLGAAPPLGIHKELCKDAGEFLLCDDQALCRQPRNALCDCFSHDDLTRILRRPYDEVTCFLSLTTSDLVTPRN